MSSEGIREFGTEEEEWNVECSDEERYEGCGDKNTDWTPKPEEIVRLLNVINETGMVELAWKCPGRRSPSPPTEEAHPRHDKAAITEE